MHRRELVRWGTAASLLAASGGVAHAKNAAASRPAPGPFDGSTVRDLARALAHAPYEKPDTHLPPAFAHLDWDAYRGIRYRQDHALWGDQHLRFNVQFLPRGYLYAERVDMFQVADGQASFVPSSPDVFDYDDPKLRVPEDVGYSGLRIHAPINRADYFDEFCVFQGASYFRAVAKGQNYGLSSRGLAIGTGSSHGEEFARFRAFWLERPAPNSDTVVVHALLDTPSATGAYRFTIRAGETTVFDTEVTLFPRTDILDAGIAPLTGMFDFDANNHERFDDWRPAAHDSDGISFWTGSGEQIFRALNNPVDLQFSAFVDSSPRGFGMMQRKRAFADYQDLALRYEKRPSLFIEPVGGWNEGALDVIELPTINEVNDNMVAFWRPREKLAAHGEYNFTYRMHWGWDCPLPTPLGRVADTRIGAGPDRHTRQIVVDFSGGPLKDPGLHLTADVGVSKGQFRNVVSEPNPDIGGWRIMFELEPGSEKLIDMHCRLLSDPNGGSGGPLTETWIYRWTS